METEEGTVYDVEMQKRKRGNIPKRTRFYQSLIDAPMLINFLHYVEDSSKEVLEESSDPRLKRLNEIIESIRSNVEMEAQYMKGITREREKIADAKAAGALEILLGLLDELGEIPDDMWERMRGELDLEVIKKWNLIATKASSIEEFRERAGLI